MVTGASRLPHIGSLLEMGTGDSLSSHAPPADSAVGRDLAALDPVLVVAPHEGDAGEKAEKKADDRDAGVDAGPGPRFGRGRVRVLRILGH